MERYNFLIDAVLRLRRGGRTEVSLDRQRRDSEYLGGRMLGLEVAGGRPGGRAERFIDGSERV